MLDSAIFSSKKCDMTDTLFFPDIITTRSWRVGQQLILRELGPSKVAKTGKTAPHSPPTHDRDDSKGGYGCRTYKGENYTLSM